MLSFSQNHTPDKQSKTSRSYFDPIHGIVQLPSYCWQFIDTPQFQRLRNVKQLGIAYQIFPSARHSRFEHCLGVSHIANSLMKKIIEKQRIQQNDWEIKCVTLAGLLHDIGHGPFSHLFDHSVMGALYPGLKWTHQQASTQLIDHLVDENNIDIDKEDLAKVQDLILGKEQYSKFDEDKSKQVENMFTFLEWIFDIVNNQRNKIDVDKFDYMKRDPHMAGFKHAGFDYQILISGAQVLDNQICYPCKNAEHIYELFNSRYNLHKILYQEKRVHQYQCTIVKLLIDANQFYNYDEIVHDMDLYTHFTDHVLYQIEHSDEPELATAKKMVCDLHKGKVYNFALQHITPTEEEGKKLKSIKVTDIVNASKDSGVQLKENDLFIKCFDLNYAFGKNNPVDQVKFFTQKDKNTAINMQQSKVSQLTPKYFSETIFRLFVKDKEKIEAAKLAWKQFMKEKMGI